MSTKNVILKDKNGNQLAPATIAEQVSYDANTNVKQAIGQASGHATVANTAAAMTDTTRIYVYTGSESGYTAGNWYYYNGSAWVSGGAYTDTLPTDPTLSVSGQAADAATVGNELNDYSVAIDNLKEGYFVFDVVFVQGGYGGSIGSLPTLNAWTDTSSMRDAYITDEDIIIELSDNSYIHQIWYLNDDGTLKAVTGWKKNNYSVLKGTKFLYGVAKSGSTVTPNDVNVLYRYKNILDLKSIASVLENEIIATAEDIIDNRFIQADGTTSPTTNTFKCTNFLDLINIANDNIEISCTIYGNASLVFYDDEKTVLSYINGSNASSYGISSIASIQIISIIKPENARYVRLSAYTSNYTSPSDLYIKGLGFGDLNGRITSLEKTIELIDSDTLSDKKILVLGDSISTDSYGNYKKWVTDLIDEGFFSNDNVTNISQHATGYVARYNSGNNRFIDRLTAVENKNAYDLVVIYGGTNDYIQNIPMGTDSGDPDTDFIPAVRYLFNYAIENFTQARICIISPTRTYATWVNQQNKYETDYFSKIRDIAKEFSFPVLNLTEQSGFAPYINTFRDMWTYVVSGYDYGDGVHPNQEYEKKYLAPMIKDFLKGLL